MHAKAKKRIEEAKGKSVKDTRPELASKLPKKGNKYKNLQGAMVRLCDDIISDPDLSVEERNKIAKLRSRVEFEL